MTEIVRDWDWWAFLYRVVHRESIPGISDWDEQLLDFLVSELHLEAGSRVLDVGCGSGVHLIGLARRGMGGIGVDIAPSLVVHANTRAQQAHVEDRVSFVSGDMRALGTALGSHSAKLAGGGSLFDAVTVLSGSFGFFDHETNQTVLEGMAECLRPGGILLLDCVAPVSAPQRRRRAWQALAGGFLLFDEWYDPETRSRLAEHRYVDGQGILNLADAPERIRLYDHPELREMIVRADLDYLAAYGGQELPPVPYDPRSPRLVIAARRRRR